MNTRVLVTYATRFGSTSDISDTIAERLRAQGLDVELLPVQDVTALNGFGAVVIGSAVQYGTWLPEAVEFVTAHQDALNRVPVALFSVHIQNQGKDAASARQRHAYLDAVKPMLQPVDAVFFAGRFNRKGARELMPKWLARFMPPVDSRNWKRIRAWADGLPTTLGLRVADPVG
ncbi:MAG: flavodoxin [Chloroflexi bacterium]|nr:flavodoxin [Chloroflexota bacterium]